MSQIQSIAAIRAADRPCSIEILVAHVDHSQPDPETLPGVVPFPKDYGLITLDLRAAQSLRSRLDAAIQALEHPGLTRDAA
jgi:hypothetical protein